MLHRRQTVVCRLLIYAEKSVSGVFHFKFNKLVFVLRKCARISVADAADRIVGRLRFLRLLSTCSASRISHPFTYSQRRRIAFSRTKIENDESHMDVCEYLTFTTIQIRICALRSDWKLECVRHTVSEHEHQIVALRFNLN